MRGFAFAMGAAALTVLASGVARADEAPRWDDEGAHACVVPFERAQRARMDGKLVEARSKLPECLADACPARVKDDCARMRDELDRAMPTTAFAVRDASGNDVDATVTLDGAPFSSNGLATATDPGPHVVTYTVAGGAPHTTTVHVFEGEKSRLVVIAAEGAPKPAPFAASAAAGADRAQGGHSAWPYVLGGSALALGALSAVFFVRANDYSQERATAAAGSPLGTTPCQVTRDNTGNPGFCAADNGYRLSTGLAFGLGALSAAALGGAVALWVLEPRTRPVHSARIAPGLGSATLDVTF